MSFIQQDLAQQLFVQLVDAVTVVNDLKATNHVG